MSLVLFHHVKQGTSFKQESRTGTEGFLVAGRVEAFVRVCILDVAFVGSV